MWGTGAKPVRLKSYRIEMGARVCVHRFQGRVHCAANVCLRPKTSEEVRGEHCPEEGLACGSFLEITGNRRVKFRASSRRCVGIGQAVIEVGVLHAIP